MPSDHQEQGDVNPLPEIMMEEDAAPPTPEAIDALVRFLPVFESAGFNPGRQGSFKRTDDGALTLPEYRYSEAVQAFVEAVYRNGWVIDFDWMEWDEGQRLCEDNEFLARADLPTIRRLLTAHVRCERFNDGHLATMFESGHMVALLRRLRELGEHGGVEDG